MTIRAAICLLSLAVPLVAAACGSKPIVARSAGEACASEDECESNLCYSATCLEPEFDDDRDGLTNAVEALLGTDPTLYDTDGDGIGDPYEVGDLSNPTDSDGDGKIDAIESSIAETGDDQDCLPDQADPDEDVVETSTEQLWDLGCCCYGPCSKFNVLDGKLVTSGGDPIVVEHANTCDDLPANSDSDDLECDLGDERFDFITHDEDGDGVDDLCDPCPYDSPDDPDQDQVCESQDNCPSGAGAGGQDTWNFDQKDNDEDGIGDVCDPDDDNDGTLDADDNCPLTFNPLQLDEQDGDGTGDLCDDDNDNSDIDGDNVPNEEDCAPEDKFNWEDDCSPTNTCGPKGCGGVAVCGVCADDEQCENNVCVPLCSPDCDGKICGDDGCGGECGEACADGEACTDGQCVPLCSPNCDGRDCGDDGCGGSCGACFDADPCSTPTCDGGTCLNTTKDCDDTDPCTDDACDDTGACVNTPVICDDSDLCTTDSCGLDGCAYTPIPCEDFDVCTEDVCDANTGCTFPSAPDGTPCDDGDLGTFDDACTDGECGGLMVGENCTHPHDLGFGDTLTLDLCDYQQAATGGACGIVGPEAILRLSGFESTDYSIIVESGPAAVEVGAVDATCTSLESQGGPPLCSAGNSELEYTTHAVGPEADFEAYFAVGMNGGDCGVVSIKASATCACDDQNPCTTDTCGEGGLCVFEPLADGALCDDGDDATFDDLCTASVCGGTLLGAYCVAPIALVAGVDTVIDVCQFTSNDGEVSDCGITGGGAFVSVELPYEKTIVVLHVLEGPDSAVVEGVWSADCGTQSFPGEMCEGVGESHNIGLQLNKTLATFLVGTTDDTCGEVTVKATVSCGCNDGNPCTADSCGADGACVFEPVAAGETCDDGDACTLDDVCLGDGTCGGAAMVCASDNPCVVSACVDGSCEGTNQYEGACDDGDLCTLDDACGFAETVHATFNFVYESSAIVTSGVGTPSPVATGTTEIYDPHGAMYTLSVTVSSVIEVGDGELKASWEGSFVEPGVLVEGELSGWLYFNPENGHLIEGPEEFDEALQVTYPGVAEPQPLWVSFGAYDGDQTPTASHLTDDDLGDAGPGTLTHKGWIHLGAACVGTPKVCETEVECRTAHCSNGACVETSAGVTGELCDDGDLCTVGDQCLQANTFEATLAFVFRFDAVYAEDPGHEIAGVTIPILDAAGVEHPLQIVIGPVIDFGDGILKAHWGASPDFDGVIDGTPLEGWLYFDPDTGNLTQITHDFVTIIFDGGESQSLWIGFGALQTEIGEGTTPSHLTHEVLEGDVEGTLTLMSTTTTGASCIGSAKDCDDDNPCTVDSCDPTLPEAEVCVFQGVAEVCAEVDDDPCTVRACAAAEEVDNLTASELPVGDAICAEVLYTTASSQPVEDVALAHGCECSRPPPVTLDTWMLSGESAGTGYLCPQACEALATCGVDEADCVTQCVEEVSTDVVTARSWTCRRGHALQLAEAGLVCDADALAHLNETCDSGCPTPPPPMCETFCDAYDDCYDDAFSGGWGLSFVQTTTFSPALCRAACQGGLDADPFVAAQYQCLTEMLSDAKAETVQGDPDAELCVAGMVWDNCSDRPCDVTDPNCWRWTVAEGGNGHYYEIVTEPSDGPTDISWSRARRQANQATDGTPGGAQLGGHLAVPSSDAEAAWLLELVKNSEAWDPGSGLWIGGYQQLGAEDPAATAVEAVTWVTGEGEILLDGLGVGPPGHDFLHYRADATGTYEIALNEHHASIYNYLVEYAPTWGACADRDHDEHCGATDVCRSVPDHGQLDTDEDGVGDACDRVPQGNAAFEQDFSGDAEFVDYVCGAYCLIAGMNCEGVGEPVQECKDTCVAELSDPATAGLASDWACRFQTIITWLGEVGGGSPTLCAARDLCTSAGGPLYAPAEMLADPESQTVEATEVREHCAELCEVIHACDLESLTGSSSNPSTVHHNVSYCVEFCAGTAASNRWSSIDLVSGCARDAWASDCGHDYVIPRCAPRPCDVESDSTCTQWLTVEGGTGNYYQHVVTPDLVESAQTPLEVWEGLIASLGVGGHLVTVTSEEERMWIFDEILSTNPSAWSTDDRPIVGAQWRTSIPDWVWLTGEPFTTKTPWNNPLDAALADADSTLGYGAPSLVGESSDLFAQEGLSTQAIREVAPIVGDDTDLDMDEVPDSQDNCPTVANLPQADRDRDGVGDACDVCPLGIWGWTSSPANDADGNGCRDVGEDFEDLDGDGDYDFADCDDSNPDVHHSALELCNGVNDDCDAFIDEEVPDVGVACDGEDADLCANGFTVCIEGGYACDEPAYAGFVEVCDELDNDCDDIIDEDPGIAWYLDSDGDGFGAENASAVFDCEAPDGLVSNNADCDDGNYDVKPEAEETCNGQDDNCADGADEGFQDLDGDGLADCVDPDDDGDGDLDVADCYPHDSDSYTGAAELCDGQDNDCDDKIDETVGDADLDCDENTCLGAGTVCVDAACVGPVVMSPVCGVVCDPNLDIMTSVTPVGRGSYGAVEVVGNRAYFGTEHGLEIYDVSNPVAPRLLGFVELPGAVDTLAIGPQGDPHGATAYAGMGVDGLVAVDVRVPSAPQVISELPGDADRPITDIVIGPGAVYVAAGWHGQGVDGVHLWSYREPDGVVDLTSQQTFISSTTASGSDARIALHGDRLYLVKTGVPEVVMLTLQSQQPWTLNIRGTWMEPNGRPLNDIAVGSFFVGEDLHQVLFLTVLSQEIDFISVISGEWSIVGADNEPLHAYVFEESRDVFAHGSPLYQVRLYITNKLGDMVAIDGEWSVPGASDQTSPIASLSTVKDIAIHGTVAYAAQGANGVQLLRVANPEVLTAGVVTASPTAPLDLVNLTDLASVGDGLIMGGSQLWTASWAELHGGLVPGVPLAGAGVTEVEALAVTRDLIVTLNDGELTTVSRNDQSVITGNNIKGVDVTVSGDYALVAEGEYGNGGLLVVSLPTFDDPTLTVVESVNFPPLDDGWIAKTVVTDGQYAYVGVVGTPGGGDDSGQTIGFLSYAIGLRVVDLSDPETGIDNVGQAADSSQSFEFDPPMRTTLVGQALYLSFVHGDNALSTLPPVVFDVSDPEHATELDPASNLSNVGHLVLSGGYLYGPRHVANTLVAQNPHAPVGLVTLEGTAGSSQSDAFTATETGLAHSVGDFVYGYDFAPCGDGVGFDCAFTTLFSHVPEVGTTHRIAVDEHLAVVLETRDEDVGGFTVYDVSAPQGPSVVHRSEDLAAVPQDVELIGDTVILASGEAGTSAFELLEEGGVIALSGLPADPATAFSFQEKEFVVAGETAESGVGLAHYGVEKEEQTLVLTSLAQEFLSVGGHGRVDFDKASGTVVAVAPVPGFATVWKIDEGVAPNWFGGPVGVRDGLVSDGALHWVTCEFGTYRLLSESFTFDVVGTTGEFKTTDLNADGCLDFSTPYPHHLAQDGAYLAAAAGSSLLMLDASVAGTPTSLDTIDLPSPSSGGVAMSGPRTYVTGGTWPLHVVELGCGNYNCEAQAQQGPATRCHEGHVWTVDSCGQPTAETPTGTCDGFSFCRGCESGVEICSGPATCTAFDPAGNYLLTASPDTSDACPDYGGPMPYQVQEVHLTSTNQIGTSYDVAVSLLLKDGSVTTCDTSVDDALITASCTHGFLEDTSALASRELALHFTSADTVVITENHSQTGSGYSCSFEWNVTGVRLE